MVRASFDFGLTWDEPLGDHDGRAAWRFYLSGFRDRAAVADHLDNYYGALFPMICAALERLLPLHPADSRHVATAVVGWAGMVYAARVAKRLGGIGPACATIVLLVASPRYLGHSMNDPKDIPFATAYAMALFYILALDRGTDRVGWGDVARVVGAIALAVNVRAMGLLLVPYALFQIVTRSRRAQAVSLERVRVTVMVVVVIAASTVLGTLFWPWALQDPIQRPLRALRALGDFPFEHRVLFAGEIFSSRALPRSYAPTWIAISTPLPILALALGSAAMLVRRAGVRRRDLALLWMATALPLAYVTLARTPMYDGARHLLFLGPPLAALAAITLGALARRARGGDRIAAGAIVALCLGLIDPITFSLARHPNQSLYFNAAVGGVDGAFGRYDMDYWGNGYRQAVDWIHAHGRRHCGPMIRITFPEPTQHFAPLETLRYDDTFFVADPRRACLAVEPATSREAPPPGLVHTVTVGSAPIYWIVRSPH